MRAFVSSIAAPGLVLYPTLPATVLHNINSVHDLQAAKSAENR